LVTRIIFINGQKLHERFLSQILNLCPSELNEHYFQGASAQSHYANPNIHPPVPLFTESTAASEILVARIKLQQVEGQRLPKN